MITILITLLAIILVLLIYAHKVDRSLLKTGKYVYKNSWLQLIITVENEKDRSNTSKAAKENDEVLIFIGSVDKMNERNPIPWKIRRRLVVDAIGQNIPEASTTTPIKVVPLKDLTDEKDNSHDW